MKLKQLFLLMIASLGMATYAEARTAPTMPEPQVLEDGGTYYLYNVGSNSFLTYDPSWQHATWLRESTPSPIKLTLVNDSEYLIEFLDTNMYLYSYNNRVENWNGYDEHCYFTFTKVNDGYYIQSTQNSSDEYLGEKNNAPYPNVTSGNILWLLWDATEETDNILVKQYLYNSLEAANQYYIDDYEAIYESEELSSDSIRKAADELNAYLEFSNSISLQEWSDYRILFKDYTKNWGWHDNNRSLSRSMENTSYTLNAVVYVDHDAVLSFYTDRWNNRGSYEVYVDNKLEQLIKRDDDWNNHFFIELAPGKHDITWKCTTNGYDTMVLGTFGIEDTPLTTIHMVEPGSLGTEILSQLDNIKDVRKLTISADKGMNEEDWERLLLIDRLYALDLGNVNITEIPEGRLSKYVHKEYEYLHSIILPERLEKLEYRAFMDSYLDSIEIPSTVTYIGAHALRGTRIRTAHLPENMSFIGEYAFYCCSFLESINWPSTITEIPSNCFRNDYYLKPFDIPQGTTSIGNRAFQYCNNFKSKIPESVTTIEDCAFEGTLVDSVTIRDGMNVGSQAFYNCDSLVYLELPPSYYQELYELVAYCDNLKNVYFKSPTMLISRYKNIFGGITPSSFTIHVPLYLVNAYKQDSYWYNYNIEGFNTEEIKDWIIRQPLTMYEGQRFEGTPNLQLTEQGALILSGDDQMSIGNFQTDRDGNNTAMTSFIYNSCDNIDITGTYTVRYYTSGKRWYFTCLPFDTKVGDIQCPSNFAIRYYDGASRAENGASGNWKNFSANDIIPAGTSFIFQTSKDCWTTFKSQDNSSKQRVFATKEITKELVPYSSEKKEDKGWNLVGNPWLTYYNIYKLNFTAPITIWNGYNYTAYSIIDDEYALEPLQAFFVQCPEELTEISFPIDGRQLTAEITDQNGARAQDNSRKLVDVELTDGELTDKTRFVLNPQASLDYETTCDASKFFSMDASVPQLYTLEQGQAMAINERPLADGTVQLGIRVAQDGAYTISAPRCQFGTIMLVDQLTGTETDLASESYHFTANSGTDNARFVLRVDGSSLSGVECVAMPSQQATPVFNLNGQRIQQPRKGLFIQGHKKIIR